MNVHTELSPAQTAQLLRTAAVFRVPAGKTRRDLVVRKGKRTRLQLAKKSTGGFSAACPASASAVEGDGLPEAVRERTRCRVADKSVQCNLLAPELFQSLDEATSHSLRPQYARKSTCNGSVSIAEGLALKRREEEGFTPAAERGVCQPAIGEPCEIMYKWGSWDVIFYETPPIPHPRPPLAS